MHSCDAVRESNRNSRRTPPELSLVLQLDAIGTTPEQAEARWGLGLVHVQQALLSASRRLTHHLEKTSV